MSLSLMMTYVGVYVKLEYTFDVTGFILMLTKLEIICFGFATDTDSGNLRQTFVIRCIYPFKELISKTQQLYWTRTYKKILECRS